MMENNFIVISFLIIVIIFISFISAILSMLIENLKEDILEKENYIDSLKMVNRRLKEIVEHRRNI